MVWKGQRGCDELQGSGCIEKVVCGEVGQNGVSSSSGNGASLSKDFRPSVGNALLSDCIKSYNNRFKQHLADEDNVESKSKLARYLLESSEDPDVEDFDILKWWKMNSSKYQVLSQIAHDVLAIPVTPQPSCTINFMSLYVCYCLNYFCA